MKTMNDVIDYVEGLITDTDRSTLEEVFAAANSHLKKYGIKVRFDEGFKDLTLDINSREYPKTYIRKNDTTYKAGIITPIRSRVVYRERMFGKSPDGYVYDSIDMLRDDIEIHSFLEECKSIHMEIQEHLKSKKEATQESSKFGLSHAFALLGTYELERIIKLTRDGKGDELVNIHKALKKKFVPNKFKS